MQWMFSRRQSQKTQTKNAPIGGLPLTSRLQPRIVVACSVALVLAACAGRPQGVLEPVSGRVAGTSQVDMLVVTTRHKSTSAGEMFTGERSLQPAFADIDISIPPAEVRNVGDVQWPKRLPGNPATDFVVQRADIISQKEALIRFRNVTAKADKRRVLVFVHGYNNRFDDAVFRFAQIVHDSDAKVAPVLFTWPSRGSLFAYGYDRESANFSRDALENLLTALANDRHTGEISILAHSMGNWVTLEALRQMAIRNGRIAPKIANVMLAAPDVDIDVFGTQIRNMGPKRPNFTLFTSRDDRALAVSRRVWGSTARLGAIDLTAEAVKNKLVEQNITVVDMSGVKSNDPLNHGTFAASPEVVRLIGGRLMGGQIMTDSSSGLGDKIIEVTAGAAASVGTATGLLLAAPVTVFDPKSRGNYGEQLNRLGETISDTAH